LKTKHSQFHIFVIAAGLLIMAACKAPRTLTEARLKPVSTNKLVRNIEENAFDYRSFDIKRISCQYETPGEKTSFRANLEAVKDKYIVVSLSKINLPVARLMLTPDSVKMINYFEKTYSINDYSSLNRFFNTNVDFDVIQSILANDIFSYRDQDLKDQDLREFISYIDSGMYVLQSQRSRKLEKIERKRKEERIERYLRRIEDESTVIQSLYIDPVLFRIRKIVLDDYSENRNLDIRFSGFEPIDDQLYPSDIQIRFKGPGDYMALKLKLSKFSALPEGQQVSFKIPDRYKRVKQR